MKIFKIFLVQMMVAFTAGLCLASPYAVEVVDYQGSFGYSPYDDPASVLGKPSTYFAAPSGVTGSVKLVEPAYNTDSDGNKLITTIKSEAYITVKFDHQVTDDANNPYGIDFLVFGNAFYTGTGYVSDTTDMNTYMLAGGGWFESVTISVSQDGMNWYTYENGPYGDSAFPTQAYEWDVENSEWTDNEMDFTKPVDPLLASILYEGGISAAAAIALYEGSGGGTGFDLAESGFEWIQYIKAESAGGEIDAFADVSAVPLPSSIFMMGIGLACLIGFGRNKY